MQGRLRNRFTFLLVAGGLGLCAYAGQQWYRLPHYSEDDLKVSVELNLQIDLARQGDRTAPEPERMEQLRRQERAEIEAEISAEKETVLRWLAAGLVLLALAGGQVVMLRLSAPAASRIG